MSRYRIPHIVAALFVVGGLLGLRAVDAPLAAAAGVMPAAGQAAPRFPSVAASPMALKREVFGFALASSLADPTVGYPSWNFAALSTVAFFGLHINGNGAIVSDGGWNVWNSSALSNLLTTAHSSNTKVVLTIVLQDFQPGTPNMCAGLTNRATTVAQAVAQVNAKHVDGINVDYESLNGTCPNGQTARSMLTDFVRLLRASMPPPAYLSVDTYASSAADPFGFFDVPGLEPYVDSYFVMAYDLEYSNWRRSPLGCTSFCLSPTAPLAGYYYNDTSTTVQYTQVVAASKVLLGVPYYGRKACVGGVAANALPIGPVTADTYLNASTEITDSAVTPGTYSAHRDSNDIAGQERWDAWFNRTLNCTRELYWDDVTSLGLKYDLINRSGLRGVGIWNLNYGGGAPELWSALLSHFAGCQAVAGTASPRSPAPAGTMVTVTASASGCGNPSPRYGFWLQPPGATTWQLLQQYSTNPNFVWNTAGKPPGTYRFSIWALDAASGGTAGNSLGRWDAYAMLSITLTSTPCTGLSATFAPVTGTLIGTGVAVKAAAGGCPNPRYQFELLNPGSQTWRIVQAYSSNAIFNWSTTGTTVGAYRFSIWARDASSQGLASSSLGSWDVFITPQYTLAKPCSGLAVTTMPNAAAPTGTNVAVTGTAFGCPNPRYQFELLTSGSQTWQIVQTYSSNATFNWNTTGYPPGAYQLSVWAKDANSPGLVGNSLGSWDVYVMAVYALTTPCTAVTAAFTPSSSAKSGTTVSISVSASGCNNPQFEFWILYPGSQTWQLARGYGAVTTFSWSTAGKPVGTYRFSVWARDAGSPGTLGNVNGTWDAYSGPYFTLT